MRDQWRAESMTRDPVVTYSRRPSSPPGPTARPAGATLTAVEVPYGDPLAQVKSAARAIRPGSITLAVVAGVAAIAAGIAVVAASYDASLLGPASQPRPASMARSAGTGSVVIASLAPIAPVGTDSAAGSPAAAHVGDVQPSRQVATTPAAVVPKTVQMPTPPLPHLRPAMPVVVVALPPARKPAVVMAPEPTPAATATERVGTPSMKSVRPEPAAPFVSSEPDSAVAEAASAPVAEPTAPPTETVDRDERGGGLIGGAVDAVDGALKSVGGLLMGALPQKPLGVTPAAAVAVSQPIQPAMRLVPVPPAPVPSVIAGAPAMAADTGQLLFVLPDSPAVVPATIIVVPGGDIRPPNTRIAAQPSAPRLRTAGPGIDG